MKIVNHVCYGVFMKLLLLCYKIKHICNGKNSFCLLHLEKDGHEYVCCNEILCFTAISLNLFVIKLRNSTAGQES